MPERMRNVPKIDSEKVRMMRSMFQDFSIRRRSCTCTLWMNAVAASHGIKLMFSTGSQAQ